MRGHLTFANVVSSLCLFIVLGGTSVAQDAVSAATKLVTGKQVKNRSLTAADIKRGTLTGAEVKDGSLAPADFSGSVAGPTGATGPAGPKGDEGDAGPVGQIQGAPAGGDLTGTYPNPTIAAGKVTSTSIFDGTITAPDLAASLSDAAAATASLRSLGTGANQAAAGNDARLSDARTPTGSAGGALAGTYPNPTLAPPGAFLHAGIPIAAPSCDVGDTWHTLSPDVNNPVSYHRDPFGIVRLRGVALRCGVAPNPIFTLPAGYRPERQEIQAAPHTDGTPKQVSINPDGTVNAWTVPATGTWLSLDGITFRCAPAGSGCP